MFKYQTNNIDEATFYILQGLQCSEKINGDRATEWVFSKGSPLDKAKKLFWSQGARVNLHSWMAIRQALKNNNRSGIANHGHKILGFHDGESYYYIQNGHVLHAIFSSKNVMHSKRKDVGNFYKTKEEAFAALTPQIK